VQTILVLEDNPAIKSIFRLVLTQKFRHVVEASNTVEALAFSSNVHLDLVIADMVLDQECGLQATVQLQALVPQLKIIISSGYPRSMWDKCQNGLFEQLKGDRVRLLQKPFLPRKLVEIVDELIGPPEVMQVRSA